jgi:pimeloyl-ACP methyl ester carboxylesterase
MSHAPRLLFAVLGVVAVLGAAACSSSGSDDGDDLIDTPGGGGKADSTDDETGGLRDPVIFVHGCPPPGVTAEMITGFWQPMKAAFVAAGYAEEDLYTFVYSGETCGSIIDNAIELSDLVDQVLWETGAETVSIVAHSMGALTTRLYVLAGGDWYVSHVVTIGGANHGGGAAAAGEQLQDMFGYPAYEGMKEMFPPYACAGEVSGGAADVQDALNGCLAPGGRLVDADETPGEPWVRYLSIRNELDEIVTPTSAACLNQAEQGDCSDTDVNVAVRVPAAPGPCGPDGCPAHVTMLFDRGVIGLTLSALE